MTPIDEDAVLKEVWNIKDIEAKTELDFDRVEAINKLGTLAYAFNSGLLKNHLNAFMVLMKSHQRASMKEFTDVVRAKREDFVQKGKNFFGGMMG